MIHWNFSWRRSETGKERMELERQMSHDTLDLLMENVRDRNRKDEARETNVP